MPSNATAAGVYAFTDFSHDLFGESQSLYGSLTLNADGTFAASVTGSLDGDTTQDQYVGKFLVASDGSFTLHVDGADGVLYGYIGNNGDFVLGEGASDSPEIIAGAKAGGSGFTPASVAGNYNFIDFTHGGDDQTQNILGTLTLKGDGTYSSDLSFNLDGDVTDHQPGSGTFTVAADGSFTLLPGGDPTGALSGHISASGELVLAQTGAQDPEIALAEKAGGGFTAASVAGSYAVVDFSHNFDDTYTSLVGTLTLLPDGTYNIAMEGSADGDVQTGQVSGTYTVTADGSLTLVVDGAAPLNGHFAANGELVMSMVADPFADPTTYLDNSPEILVGLRNPSITQPATDVTPPEIVSTVPDTADEAVPVGSNITITFNEAITLGTGAIQLYDAYDDITDNYSGVDVASISVKGNTLTIHPAHPLADSTAYYVVLAPGSVRDLAGNFFEGTSDYYFYTEGDGSRFFGTTGDDDEVGTALGDTLDGGGGNDTIDGGAGNDIVDGGTGNNLLMGGLGNDVLIGVGGNNTMEGGDGADLYYVNSPDDIVIETSNNSAGELDPAHPGDVGRAVDKVIASINYTLTAFVENLTLAPAAGNLAGNGNELNNVITGNEGNNVLTGGAGNDTIDGGGGIDTAVYTGKFADYKITVGTTSQAPATTVTDQRASSPDGSDSLTNVERLKFADEKLALDLGVNDAGGKTVLILGAALGAVFPNNHSLAGLVLGYFDGGGTVLSGAKLLLDTGIEAAFAGGSDNTSLVKFIYTNVNGKAPDAATLANLVAPLNNHSATMAQWLTDMAESPANQAHVQLAGFAVSGLQYV
jgi:hypothetical protein